MQMTNNPNPKNDAPGDKPSLSVSFLIHFDGALHPITLEAGERKIMETGRRPTDEGWEYLGADLSFDGESVTFIYAKDGSDCDGRLSSVVELKCHKDKLAALETQNGFFPDWERVSEQQRDYQAERAGY